jgi:hypothetical protein
MSGMNIMLSGQGLELTGLGAASIESQECLTIDRLTQEARRKETVH